MEAKYCNWIVLDEVWVLGPQSFKCTIVTISNVCRMLFLLFADDFDDFDIFLCL